MGLVRLAVEGLVLPMHREYCFGPSSAKRQPVDEKINLAEKLALLEKPFEPGIVGFINDYKLQVVKVKGSFVWHKHDETDDFFLVLSGRLTIHLRDRDLELGPGELFVVPRGVEHCPEAEEETQVLLIEPRDTVNTGDAGGEMTAQPRML
jgi:mannose-6-phosphate isomerase-like protein (cupin superfamily)